MTTRKISSLISHAIFLLFLSHYPSFAMSFTLAGTGGNCNGCEWIAAEGEITSSTPSEFAKFVQEHQFQNIKMTVTFNSPGGSLYGGIQLGTLIRQYGFVTSVGKTVPDGYNHHTSKNGICASACVFAFIGGITRFAETAELGIHQFYDDYAVSNPDARLFNAKDLSVQQIISGILISYATEMGVSPLIIAKSSSVPPNEMYFLTKTDLVEMKILQNNDQFGPWEIKANSNSFYLQSTTPDGKQEAYIFCASKKLNLAIYAKFLGTTNLDLKSLSNDIKYISYLDIMGVNIPPAAVSTKLSNGIVGLQVTLPNDFYQKVDISRPGFYGDTYRAIQHKFVYSLSNQNLSNGLKLIQNSCSK